MNSISNIQQSFAKIENPKYLEVKIQELALIHLGLRDLGELRDRYEGQSYLNKLREEIRAEYSFLRHIGVNFNWKEKEDSTRNGLKFELDGNFIQLSVFTMSSKPVITEIIPTVLILMKPEKYCYVGPILIGNEVNAIKEIEENSLTKKTTLDINKLNLPNLNYFKSKEDILKIIKS